MCSINVLSQLAIDLPQQDNHFNSDQPPPVNNQVVDGLSHQEYYELSDARHVCPACWIAMASLYALDVHWIWETTIVHEPQCCSYIPIGDEMGRNKLLYALRHSQRAL